MENPIAFKNTTETDNILMATDESNLITDTTRDLELNLNVSGIEAKAI